MVEEITSIEKNKTWELTKLPIGKKFIDVRRMFKLKVNHDVKVVKHKFRLVAKGFMQRKGNDYDEFFSPVTRYETITIVITLACNRRWPLFHLDVKSSFLNGLLKEEEEEVFIAQTLISLVKRK